MFGRGLPPPPTPHKHKACRGLIEWLDTEWYLLLQLSILTTFLLANIKMDHSVYSHQVKCERIWAALRHTNYVICCFTFFSRWEMHTSLIRSATIRSSFSVGHVGHIKSDGLRLSNHHVIPLTSFCSQFFCHSFQWSQIANSVKLGHHFKQDTNPYRYRRSFLIGSPLSSLSSAPLHDPHKGTIIHHTPNLFCHFSFGWEIRARGPYWFYKKHEAETPEVECLPVIDNWSNNHDRQKKKHIWAWHP